MSSNNTAVQVSNLSVKFDDFYAVKNISFAVEKGEIFGFLGANGAGKTTTIRVLCGLIPPTEGHVLVGNQPFENEADGILIKHNVGYMSQKFTLYNDLTVEENLFFIASLRKLDFKTYAKKRDTLLKFIEFQHPLNTLVAELPSGIKQQVSLVGSLLHDPDIIFLDEPTAGVSPIMRRNFWRLIRTLSQNQKTIFVTTHYMDEAEQCDRIALMREGEIVALDTPKHLKATVFSDHFYELIPKHKMSYQDIKILETLPEFKFFEPYGLRFHVEFKNQDLETFKNELTTNFFIKEITPTLEDVFIKIVESKH